MKKFSTLSKLAALAFIGGQLAFATAASANVGYSYSGNLFDSFSTPGTNPGTVITIGPGSAIQGAFFTGSALDANLAGAAINPLSWDFAAGAFDFTQLNSSPSAFQIWTDATGAISDWKIMIDTVRDAQGRYYSFESNTKNALGPRGLEWAEADVDLAGTSYFSTWGGINGNPGHWTQFATVATVPEPETYVMLLAGLGLLGVAARRKAKMQ